jgi:membrane fusion protein (multidrug efflux system)
VKSLTTLAGLALAGTFYWGICGAEAQQNGAPRPLVDVMEVKPADLPIVTEYAAQTYARNEVEVRGRVEGYVEKWLFRPGQEVTTGQPLYVLDLRPLEAAAETAAGNLRQSQADLEFASKQVSLQQAEANLAVAQANLLKARQDFDRLKPLVEQDAAPRQDLETATAALQANEAAMRAAQVTVDQTRLQTDTQIQSTQGKVEALRGTLKTASLNVEYGTIRAPISGLIGDTSVNLGSLVNPASTGPLTTIVPLDPIWVRFKLNESQYLSFMRAGKLGAGKSPPLELLLADGTAHPGKGRIENSLNQVDPRTGTLEVQAAFPNPKHTLLPGQFGKIRFQTDLEKGVLAVPQRAVLQTQNTQSVYTVSQENKIQQRAVKTGNRVGDLWIIEQGLKPGDRVVVEGLLNVQPGATVTTRPWNPAAAAATSAPATGGGK